MKKLLLTLMCFFTILATRAQIDEDFSTWPPTGWSLTSDGTGTFEQGSEVGGLYAFYDVWNTSSSAPSYLQTPTISVTSTDKYFQFDEIYYLYAGTYGSGSTLKVEVSADSGTTWTSSANLSTADNTWDTNIIDLSSFEGVDFTGSNVVVRFRATSDYGSWQIGVDNVLFPFYYPAIPVCSLNVSPVDGTSYTDRSNITLSWDAAAEATSYDVYYGSDSSTPTLLINTASTSVTSTFPINQQTYWKVVPKNATGSASGCSVQSFTVVAPSGPAGLSCDAGDQSTSTFSESFDDLGSWTGDISTANTNGAWQTGNSGGTISSTTGPDAGQDGDYMYWEGSGTNGVSLTGSAISPSIDLSAIAVGEQAELTFYMHAYGVSTGILSVSASSTVDGTYTDLFSWDGQTQASGAADWIQVGLDVSAYSGANLFVKFTVTGSGIDYRGDLGIDSMEVNICEEIPSCLAPSSLSASVTPTTATLSWTENGTATTYNLDVVLSGAGQSTTPSDIGVSNNFLKENLTPDTDYQYYVQADCGFAGESSWVGPYNFSTPCSSNTTPYFEGFETGYTDATTVGGCIVQESISGSGSSWQANSSATTYNRSPRTGSFNAYLRYSNEDWMFIQFDLTAGTSYDFSMYARQDGSGSTNSNITVSYGDTAAAASMTNSIVAVTGIVNGEYQQIAGSFTPSATATYYIGVKGYMNGSPWYISIDDISLAETPPCSAPLALTAGSLTDTSAVLSWTEAGTASLYNVDVVAQGAAQTGATGTDPGVSNSYLKENLSSNTSYDFYVQADCGLDGVSDWAGPYNFTTLAGCGDTTYDTGGASGNYSNSEDYTATYAPDTGDLITLDFTSVDLENCCDTLRIYDGADTNATLLNGDIQTPQSFTSSTDAGLTIRFTSDSSVTGAGWAATISCFTPCNWNGATSTDWADVSNWSTGAVPTSSDNVYIDGTFTNEPSISSTDAAAGSVTVATGNTLTIDETSSLTVSGDFTNTGTVTLNSTADDYSSLIVTGTASGDIVYNRYVNVYDDTLGGGWDLVCSPVGMSIADFITANGSNIQVLGDDYAFSQFNNATGQWERYATASQTGNFEAGKGYSMATTGGSTVAFTGAMQTADQSINIINNNGLNGVGRRWNLVSNPFPSYILGNTAAGTNNFMDANSAVIDSEFLAVYGWNGSSYTIYNQLSGAFSMAPGQGFWVAALNTTDTALNFTAAMRTTTGTGDFVSGPQLLTYNVAVKLYNGEIEKATTDFYFRDGLSLDLDPGYDAAAFNQSMALSTRLPQGSQETAFGINAMGMDAMQNTRVPLEIRQNAGQAFRVSIADMELPEDIYVYLEDTLNGTLTSLKDQDFELVAQSNLSGVDRFFIVFKSNSVLSNGDTLGINALNVYKANTDSFVTIAGISPELGKLNVSLYNILGQTVREKALSSATATQTVSTDGLASGLYIVQIRSGNQTTVKKIIVK